MRRKIKLYIGEQLVDLDDQSFILFNYTMDDLSNPTIVKNSFSQQITLKGTPRNNRVFGDAFKVDRRVAHMGGNTEVDFNAAQKTPFTIYNEMGEILESGYVKLDSVSRKGVDIQYKITLFGGLGSFFYALSYDENGNRRTLADLDYLGTVNPETELDFVINAASVREAWQRLQNDTSAPAKWDVINFAPAYNGIPEGNFSPNKGIILPSDVGLENSIIEGEGAEAVEYTTKAGYALVNFAEAQDEWAVKDLRSYLQRPVFSMNAFWDAICNPANNGGYEVDASVVQDWMAFSYTDLWMTLPMITSIGTIHQESGDLSLTLTSSGTTDNAIGRYNVSGSVPAGTRVTANINCKVRFNAAASASQLQVYANRTIGRNVEEKFSAIFIQALAYGSDNSIIGGSKIKFGGVPGSVYRGSDLAAACSFTPAWDADYEKVTINQVNRVSSGVYEIPAEMGFTIEAANVAYYQILVYVYPGISYYTQGAGSKRTSFSGNGRTSCPTLYTDFDTPYEPSLAFIVQGAANSVSYTTSKTLRSGATITKAMLLSSSHTPAEYMLSFCKVFGLYFTYDVATKKVTIRMRNALYQDETIDLTKRVDRSKGISILPLVTKAKWYDFLLDGVGGAFYDEYLQTEGIPYGIQRVNSGYDFNADSVNLMDSVVFKNACTILGRSKYFNYISALIDGVTKYLPSPFIDKGNTYTLWSIGGETLETPISCPPESAVVEYFNENSNYKGYDVNTARKLELRSADNKPVDGADILVFLEGFENYSRFLLSDDIPAMDVLNDGIPCWLLTPSASVLRMPTFARYKYGATSVIESSLDFGIPRQFDIPGVRQASGCTIYERYWKAYMADRYDENTKVMTCFVNFGGIQVSQELLRKFYWYENTLWVLNKIKNHSLTTYDPVECEFVQVQDKVNYTQNLTTYYLIARPDVFSFDENAGWAVISIQSNVSWEIISNDPFVIPEQSSGRGDRNVSFNVTANEGAQRSTTIRVRCTSGEGLPDVVINVSQDAASQTDEISASPDVLSIPPLGGSATAIVTSSLPWTATPSASWISVSPLSGSVSGQIVITADENASSSVRTGFVLLQNSAGSTFRIGISQASPSLSVRPSSFNLAYNDTSDYEIYITSNAAWSAVADDEWLTINGESGILGSGNDVISLRATINSGSSARRGSISISRFPQGMSATVVVEQAGTSDPSGSVEIWNPDRPGKTPAVTIRADSNGFNIMISAGGAWRISTNDSWLSEFLPGDWSGDSAVSNETRFIGAQPNTTGAQRIGILTLSLVDDPSSSADFIVTQLA